MKRALAGVLAFAVLAIVGREVARQRHDAPARPAGIILITLDATRADRLPPYPGAGPLPAIARLASEGVVFDRAIAPAPLTLPSHSSLFTGLLPPAHGVRVNGSVLAPGRPLFPEALRTAGYRTAAFVGSIVLDRHRGLGRGFDEYGDLDSGAFGDRRTRRAAAEVLDDALAWLESLHGAPFFLWVHLFDAHAPHALPETIDASPTGNPYDGAIALMDRQIGRLRSALETKGIFDRTAVIVTADHGESLGDHGENGHGIFIYESAIRVPLIVRWPGVPPRRVPDLAQIVDVAPTVLELQGLPLPPMDGISLVPLLIGGRSEARTGYAESLYPMQYGWSALRSVRGGRFKLIDAPRPELYNLEADPGETRNLHDIEPAAARELLAKLRTFGAIGDVPADASSAENRERLASLGYASTTSRPATPPATWPDPKDMIATYNAIVEERVRRRAR
jgi:arylsulfatase A-like enzyme